MINEKQVVLRICVWLTIIDLSVLRETEKNKEDLVADSDQLR